VGATDLAIALAILAATLWVLYRSLWKTRGGCHGCTGGGCGSRKSAGSDHLVKLGERGLGGRQ
jgi:FeoB-associated Cys-rich membrane protein